jgi:hypothetical protein
MNAILSDLIAKDNYIQMNCSSCQGRGGIIEFKMLAKAFLACNVGFSLARPLFCPTQSLGSHN